MVKSNKEIGIVPNHDREMHFHNVHWNQAPLAPRLVIPQKTSKLGVFFEDLLQLSPDPAMDIPTKGGICVQSFLLECSRIEVEVVEQVLLCKSLEIKHFVANGNPNPRSCGGAGAKNSIGKVQ